MYYGKMMTRDHLLKTAAPALVPLFEAYAEQRERGLEWRAQIGKEVAFPELDALFDQFQNIALFPIADAISLLGDNVARVYAHIRLNDEDTRKSFGNEVAPNFPFGKLLWVAGNAARHYADEPFRQLTEEALKDLGVQRRDEGTAFEALEIAKVGSYDAFIGELALVCEQIEAAA